MDIDKLTKAIRILIKEELKQQLPVLIKEVTKREVANRVGKIKKSLLREMKAEMKRGTSQAQPQVEEQDPFTRAQQALDEDRKTNGGHQTSQQDQEPTRFSKNPMINDILNETAHSNQKPQQPSGQDEFRSMNFNSSDVGRVAAHSDNPQMDRSTMAAKMGYGDMAGGASMPQTTISNKPVNPDDPNTQKVQQAMQRDYSELVKRFKK